MNNVSSVPNLVRLKRVLCSVYDKTGIEDFIGRLFEINPDLIVYSTGGTFKLLSQAFTGKAIVSVSDYTGQPELQGGLVKTLDYKIYLSLLTEPYNTSHSSDMARVGAHDMDAVICNLYPFQKVVEDARSQGQDTVLEIARSFIDIGGPTMVRSAAKNFHRIAAITSPSQYSNFIEELEKNQGQTTLAHRFGLMQEAFSMIARYDGDIERFVSKSTSDDVSSTYTIEPEPFGGR